MRLRPKQTQGNRVVFGDERLERQSQRQARLAALAEKRGKGRLTLEDIFEQQQVIIEMLNELLERDAR